MIIDDVNDDATMPAADADGEEGGEGADTGEAAEEVQLTTEIGQLPDPDRGVVFYYRAMHFEIY